MRRVLRPFKRLYCRTLSFICARTSINTEAWYWLRQIVTFVPGNIGILTRAVFYHAYLKRSSLDLVILPGSQIAHPHKVEIGSHCSISADTLIDGVGGIEIGDWTGIGPQVFIHSANHNYNDLQTPFLEQGWTFKPVKIGADVWIAAQVMVMPGTEIGDGSVIIAGSVVSGVIKARSVVGGNPGRVVALRAGL
jgi:acetyltransferase-like isoleucine patch superfamily enzyme